MIWKNPRREDSHMDKKSGKLIEKVEHDFKIFFWHNPSFMESPNTSEKLVNFCINQFFSKFILYEMFASCNYFACTCRTSSCPTSEWRINTVPFTLFCDRSLIFANKGIPIAWWIAEFDGYHKIILFIASNLFFKSFIDCIFFCWKVDSDFWFFWEESFTEFFYSRYAFL